MCGLGVSLGLGATYVAVRQGYGFGVAHAGPWTVWPQNGTPEIDPYARAILARTGEIPLGLAEGLSLIARKDDLGDWLDGSCDYVVSGRLPVARFWTLTLLDPDGRLVENPLRRYGLTSSEIVRPASGPPEITLSLNARPGDWLPIGRERRFMLALRLYDTVISASAATIEAANLPRIARKGCR